MSQTLGNNSFWPTPMSLRKFQNGNLDKCIHNMKTNPGIFAVASKAIFASLCPKINVNSLCTIHFRFSVMSNLKFTDLHTTEV